MMQSFRNNQAPSMIISGSGNLENLNLSEIFNNSIGNLASLFISRNNETNNQDINNVTNDDIIANTIVSKFSELENPLNSTCPITSEVFNDEDDVLKLLKCGHIYEQNAIREWFRSPGGYKCPMCRTDFRQTVEENQQSRDIPLPNNTIQSPNNLYRHTLTENTINGQSANINRAQSNNRSHTSSNNTRYQSNSNNEDPNNEDPNNENPNNEDPNNEDPNNDTRYPLPDNLFNEFQIFTNGPSNRNELNIILDININTNL